MQRVEEGNQENNSGGSLNQLLGVFAQKVGFLGAPVADGPIETEEETAGLHAVNTRGGSILSVLLYRAPGLGCRAPLFVPCP